MNICVLFSDGVEEIEFITPVDILRRCQQNVVLVSSKSNLSITGAHGIRLLADTTISQINSENFDALIIPGGPSAFVMKDDTNVIDLVQQFYRTNKWISAICAAPIILHNAGILSNKKYCSHPCVHEELSTVDTTSRVVVDKPIITAAGPGVATEFALEIISQLLGEAMANVQRHNLLLS